MSSADSGPSGRRAAAAARSASLRGNDLSAQGGLESLAARIRSPGSTARRPSLLVVLFRLLQGAADGLEASTTVASASIVPAAPTRCSSAACAAGGEMPVVVIGFSRPGTRG